MTKAFALHSTAAVALAAGLALQPQAAGAQTAPAAVDEVVVTAQRRSEQQVDVPISVTVLSASRLERSNVTSSVDLPVLAPGLRMDQTGAFAVPTIRGVGTPVTSNGASPTAIYIDGVYQPNSLSNIFDLNNIDAVQVLKGPQ